MIEKIMSNRLDRRFFRYQEEYEKQALEVLRSGFYILGKEVKNFEDEFASYIGAKYCVGLASGLDALWITFNALGIGAGDEVIIQANAYIACVMGITINGATPIFVEPDEYYNLDASKIEEKITEKTKAILVVHLYGQASNMSSIVDIAKRHSLVIVEDCAQSHGAKWDGKMTGTFGTVGCYSFYPSKNLGAFGDGGAIVTNCERIEKRIRIFRNYGSEKKYSNCVVGANSRLDEIQAGLLRVGLRHLDEINVERNRVCKRYLDGIVNEKIVLPQIRKKATTVWHQFVIRCKDRNKLRKFLEDNGIQTDIHYPIPPYLQEAYKELNCKAGDYPIAEKYANEMLSLPLYTEMKEEEIDKIINTINMFS